MVYPFSQSVVEVGIRAESRPIVVPALVARAPHQPVVSAFRTPPLLSEGLSRERPTPFLGRRDISCSRSIAASNASNVAKAAARRSGVGSGSGSDEGRMRDEGRAIARMASMCGCASALLASPISGGLYELFTGCLRALSLGGGDATATSGGASGPVSGSISLYPPPHFWKYRGGYKGSIDRIVLPVYGI